MENKTEHRYKVNVLHNGKERWRYTRTINKAMTFQEVATLKGLSSTIYQKVNGKYQPYGKQD